MKKWLAGLVPALILLLAVSAAFAGTLTPAEIVEQVVVPLASANDRDYSVNTMFSAAELAEVVRALNDNGITLEETDLTMQMLINGHDLFEETVITEICGRAFGGRRGTWTLEQQDWFERQLVKIGALDTYRGCMPGPDSMVYADAEALALRSVRGEYGADLELEDRNLWTLQRYFNVHDEEQPEDQWYFSWEPNDPELGRYAVWFNDRNPEETVNVEADIPDWTKPYTGDWLLERFCSIYSWSQEKWSQAVWRKLHEMMQGAAPDPEGFYYAECEGYRLTGYPDPGTEDISREEAVRIAKDALKKPRAALGSAVLAEYEGERSWLVAMVINQPWNGTVDDGAGRWIVTVDSRTGEVRSLREGYSDAAFVPEAAYNRARAGLPEEPDYAGIAAAAVREQYPDLDPLDETLYSVLVQGVMTKYVDFRPKDIRHGVITVTLTPEGTVTDITADAGELTGDNIFQRYRIVYGYFGGWDQERWTQLDRDKEGLEADTLEGAVLLASRYPAEDSAAIGREQAEELALRADGDRLARVNSCVLADAYPHPVWITRVIGAGADDAVIGIDAETGEVMFTEDYTVDETPGYVQYSTPGTWRPLERLFSGEAPTPTPLPEGKPWYWGKDFAPPEFWEQAEAFMKANGITEEHIEEQAEAWDQRWGGCDFWPQEYQAVYNLHLTTEETLADPEADYLPFPDPAKKTQEEIGEIARAALHVIGDAELGKEQVDSFRIASTLYPDSRNPDREGENFGRRVWWVWFYEWIEEDRYWSAMRGYAILDEDGTVLAAGTGETGHTGH